MASVRWRKGGWELRYRDRKGGEQTERFPGSQRKTPPDAVLDRKAEVERDLRRGTYVSVQERRATFGEYYQRWRASRRISAARLYTDDQRADKHLLPYWKDWAIAEIRPSDIDDWVAQLGTTMNGWSVRSCYTLLRGPLRRAIKDGIITDPCVDIALPPKPKIRKTFDDVLSRDEVRRLVAAVPDPDPRYATLRTSERFQTLIMMGCWLGPRWNEAIGVRRCDLNIFRKEIAFGRVVVNQNGSHIYTENLSKTEDARVVPVPDEVMAALLAHIDRYCANAGSEDFLFLNQKGEHPSRNGFSRNTLKKAAGRAGLGHRRITWLTLRHTAASLMFDAGLNIFDVQRRLGHASPTMTMEVYTHLMRERFEEGRELMNRYIAGNDESGTDSPAVGEGRQT
jgi:integrase